MGRSMAKSQSRIDCLSMQCSLANYLKCSHRDCEQIHHMKAHRRAPPSHHGCRFDPFSRIGRNIGLSRGRNGRCHLDVLCCSMLAKLQRLRSGQLELTTMPTVRKGHRVSNTPTDFRLLTDGFPKSLRQVHDRLSVVLSLWQPLPIYMIGSRTAHRVYTRSLACPCSGCALLERERGRQPAGRVWQFANSRILESRKRCRLVELRNASD